MRTSQETIEIKPGDPEKREPVETIVEISILILNEMIDTINETSDESNLQILYNSIEGFIKDNEKEYEKSYFQNLLQALAKKIALSAKLQEENRMGILEKFLKFTVYIHKSYGGETKCSRGSILLHVIFSSKEGYDLYKEDLKNGRIGEQIMELFLFPPFLESFGLKTDDIKISLNGSLLTQQRGKEHVKHY